MLHLFTGLTDEFLIHIKATVAYGSDSNLGYLPGHTPLFFDQATLLVKKNAREIN
jgi:hypothetical protein